MAGPLRAGHGGCRAAPGARHPARAAHRAEGPPSRRRQLLGLRGSDGKRTTGLAGYLRERGIARVFICGLATDFCVAWSALDARKAGFEVVVIEDACRAIDTGGSLAAAWRDMDLAGVKRISSRELAGPDVGQLGQLRPSAAR